MWFANTCISLLAHPGGGLHDRAHRKSCCGSVFLVPLKILLHVQGAQGDEAAYSQATAECTERIIAIWTAKDPAAAVAAREKLSAWLKRVNSPEPWVKKLARKIGSLRLHYTSEESDEGPDQSPERSENKGGKVDRAAK